MTPQSATDRARPLRDYQLGQGQVTVILTRRAAIDPATLARQAMAALGSVGQARPRGSPQQVSMDMFDPAQQARIEEAIRQQQVAENMELAMEHSPESFGSVIMLYVNGRVNDHDVKIFVDSGAQMTIMSVACAQRCNIMRLLDKRFAGTAVGVGTGSILGRIHLAQVKIGNTFFPSSFAVMDNVGFDFLFGLDNLKKHACCIDLAHSVLRIGDEAVPFLSEHEIGSHDKLINPQQELAASGAASGAAGPGDQTAAAAPPQQPAPASAPAQDGAAVDEAVVTQLMALGNFPREQVKRVLESCQGNAELAAGLLLGME